MWWWHTDYGRPGWAGRCSIVLRGHWNAGGGEAEISAGIVYSLREERFERFELYPPEAADEMQARVDELAEAR